MTIVPTHSENSHHFDRSSWLNIALRPVFLLCASLGILLLGGLIVVLTLGALGSFSQTNGPSLALTALGAKTLLTSAIALVIAAPIGLLAALYLSEFAPVRIRGIVEPLLRFLARVPPIVYGYFAVSTLLPALIAFVPALADFPLMQAGIALAGMIAPRFLEQARDAIATMPQQLRDAACALGGGPLTTARFVVVPATRTRLLSAFVAAASRAVGETMIVLVVLVTYASRQTPRPDTLTTFLVPNGRGLWSNQVPKEFFLAGIALLLLSFALDAARQSLDDAANRGHGP